MLLYSVDFNSVKKRLKTYYSEKQSASVERQVHNALHDIFVTLQFQPTVLQNNGGNLCGFIACNIIKYLSEITDTEDLLKFFFSANKITVL